MYVTSLSTLRTTPKLELVSSRSATADSRVSSGTNLYYEGDTVERLFEVTSGVLRLTRLLEDGRRQVIAFAYPGDIVGFPCDGLHHTDCDALVDSTLRRFSITALEDGLGDPDLHKELLQAALREIAGMQDHFMMLGQKSSLEKVASFLCTLTDRVGVFTSGYPQVELPMSRADIADFLGLTTETVSRTLTHLRKENVIAIKNVHTVLVRQPEELLRLSVGEELDLAS